MDVVILSEARKQAYVAWQFTATLSVGASSNATSEILRSLCSLRMTSDGWSFSELSQCLKETRTQTRAYFIRKSMGKTPQEWLKQADYDMDTEEFMFNGKRYFYAVFMCHLAIEKALKGFLKEKLEEEPPKVHNLIHFLNKTGTKPRRILEGFS